MDPTRKRPDMTYQLVLTYTARDGGTGADERTVERVYDCDDLSAVARVALRYRNQFNLADCAGADVWDAVGRLNEWPLETAIEVAEFCATFESAAA